MSIPASLNSCIYEGTVCHTRLSPKKHHFSYRVYMTYIDLAEQDQFFSLSKLWSNKGFNLAWFKSKDYLSSNRQSLDCTVRNCVEEATGVRPDGPIRALTNLRTFGFLINPISCYYCFSKEEDLRYIVAEVTSTPWKEKIAYVIPCLDGDTAHEHLFEKKMHVSPFMEMNMQYKWRSNTPGQALALALQNLKDGELCFHATLALTRRPASKENLNRVLLTYPFITMKIGLSIYWQALRLFLKGIPFIKRRKEFDTHTTKENPSQ